jgi:ABC-type dipeptide/oligopeptide/nickel transport system permease subunit
MRLLWLLSGSWAARFGMLVLAAAVAFALAPALFAGDPQAQDLGQRLRPPDFLNWSQGHVLGTDHLGRDLWARIVDGTGTTLGLCSLAVLVAALVGVMAGLAAGFVGGWTDAVIQRLIDVQLAFPLILLVIAVVAVLGPSLANLVLIMGLSGWPRFARIVRGNVLTVRELDYVAAAKAVGARPLRIMMRHVLPNVASAIIVYASFEMARMILLEATLSFLGLGVQPPTPTWGGMINDGRKYIALNWSVSLAPGIAIALLILACNLVGDALRDALDPTLRED